MRTDPGVTSALAGKPHRRHETNRANVRAERENRGFVARDSGFDLVAVLTKAHRQIERSLGELQRVEHARWQERRALALSLARQLVRHWENESVCLYPAARKFLVGAENLIEHDQKLWLEAVWIMRELEDIDPQSERLGELTERLTASVRNHVEDQATGLLNELRMHANRWDLEWLGDRVGEPSGDG